MPIYEFICNDCGTEFEKLLSFSATVTPICPTCQGENVKRQMGLPAVHFKGSGWYITDSKKSTGAKKDGNGVATGKSEGGESSGQSESSDSKDSVATSEGETGSKKSETVSTSTTETSVSE